MEELIRLAHALMKINDNTIAFKIKYGDSKKQRQCTGIEIVQILVQFRLINLLLETVLHNHKQSEEQEAVGGHADVSQHFE